jgi:AGCS family alanine or glycine:cation symporter
MSNLFFKFLTFIDSILWYYVNFVVIILAGIFFTWLSRGAQFKAIKNFRRNISTLIKDNKDNNGQGVNPFKLYFTSVGGMVGLGNIVSISGAVSIGGPGSIFWMWVASFIGMLMKYGEIYLGINYRAKNNNNSYDGGPMYFLQGAFKSKIAAYASAILLCIYGAEVYQFLILTDRVEATFNLNRYLVLAGLLALVFLTVVGGVHRLSNICSVMMPPFLLTYLGVAIYIICLNFSQLGEVFSVILSSAFSGHAPIAGFAGSTLLMAAHQGISRGVYSGDIAIGYDSVVQSETRVVKPEQQATLAIYGLATDTLICTFTTLILVLTGGWYEFPGLEESELIPRVLAPHIPYFDYFMTLLLFVAGFTTITAYLTVGIKCAKFISPKYGKYLYYIYALFAFIYFSHHDQSQVMLVMSVSGGILMLLNLSAIVRLRDKIRFSDC